MFGQFAGFQAYGIDGVLVSVFLLFVPPAGQHLGFNPGLARGSGDGLPGTGVWQAASCLTETSKRRRNPGAFGLGLMVFPQTIKLRHDPLYLEPPPKFLRDLDIPAACS